MRSIGHAFFPNLIASPFMDGLRDAFYVSPAMATIGAIASFFRGKRYIHGHSESMESVVPPFGANVGADITESAEMA